MVFRTWNPQRTRAFLLLHSSFLTLYVIMKLQAEQGRLVLTLLFGRGDPTMNVSTFKQQIMSTAEHHWRSAGRRATAHWRAAEVDQRWHWVIGIPSTVLAALVATAVFTTLSEQVEPTDWQWWVVAAIAGLAAILAALQTFLGMAKRAESHRAAAARYDSIIRDVSLLRLAWWVSSFDDPEERAQAQDQLKSTIEEFNTVTETAPALSEREFKQGVKDWDGRYPPGTWCDSSKVTL